MSYSTVIRNATIINEGEKFIGDLSIENKFISGLKKGSLSGSYDNEIDATGLLLIPGMIDDQVHFREPGLTQKLPYILNLEPLFLEELLHLWKCQIPSLTPQHKKN